MSELTVRVKPGLALTVVISSSNDSDTSQLRWAASVLATVAGAVDEWQSKYGSVGTPMPPPPVEETKTRLKGKA